MTGCIGRLIRAVVLLVAVAVGVPLIAVLALRVLPPPTSAFVLRVQLEELAAGRSPRAVEYDWVAWAEISPAMRLAVVAAEDQLFPVHDGFDVESIRDALEERERGRPLRGASTITQQTVKNLYLWPGRSWLRKGLEAALTALTEALWPKRRILEVYLNVAQFGPTTFGVEAAARRFFGKPAAELSAHEASLLAAVLPNPYRMHVDRPSAYVYLRAVWIRRQMRQLGAAYLDSLESLSDK
ncbi:MAG: monofunctional biosynthetic peptidoglycan transglycosylase [Thermoanaerobaculia bacterium]